jgi:hypothetical protein
MIPENMTDPAVGKSRTLSRPIALPAANSHRSETGALAQAGPNAELAADPADRGQFRPRWQMIQL